MFIHSKLKKKKRFKKQGFMRGFPKHERRWASDTVAGTNIIISSGSSPGGGGDESIQGSSSSTSSNNDNNGGGGGEEFVEVTLDFQDDDTIVLRSVEPAAAAANVIIDIDGTETPVSSSSRSRSPTMRRSSSHKFSQFSQELKAKAIAKAKQFSQDIKAELRRFSWSHNNASRAFSASASSSSGVAGVVT